MEQPEEGRPGGQQEGEAKPTKEEAPKPAPAQTKKPAVIIKPNSAFSKRGVAKPPQAGLQKPAGGVAKKAQAAKASGARARVPRPWACACHLLHGMGMGARSRWQHAEQAPHANTAASGLLCACAGQPAHVHPPCLPACFARVQELQAARTRRPWSSTTRQHVRGACERASSVPQHGAACPAGHLVHAAAPAPAPAQAAVHLNAANTHCTQA